MLLYLVMYPVMKRQPKRAMNETSWDSESTVLEALESLDRVRNENALYVSKNVDAEVDRFINTIYADLDFELRNRHKRGLNWLSRKSEYAGRAVAAFESLKNVIRKSLGIEDMILG